EILDKIAEKITFELPDTMVEAEEKRLFEDFKNHISQNFQMGFEEYLKTVKETEEEIKKSFRTQAEKRIRNFLILREIGKKENIEVSLEEIEEDVNKIVKSYSKEQLDKIDIEQLREYSKGV